MKNKINQEKKVIIKYSVYCPKCDKKITGFSKSQVEYALGTHIKQKHAVLTDQKKLKKEGD